MTNKNYLCMAFPYDAAFVWHNPYNLFDEDR